MFKSYIVLNSPRRRKFSVHTVALRINSFMEGIAQRTPMSLSLFVRDVIPSSNTCTEHNSTTISFGWGEAVVYSWSSFPIGTFTCSNMWAPTTYPLPLSPPSKTGICSSSLGLTSLTQWCMLSYPWTLLTHMGCGMLIQCQFTLIHYPSSSFFVFFLFLFSFVFFLLFILVNASWGEGGGD